MPAADRERLHKVVAQLYNPDPAARRRKLKEAERARMQKAEAVLHETGIRALRRKPVFTTPNVFPPPDFQQQEEREHTAAIWRSVEAVWVNGPALVEKAGWPDKSPQIRVYPEIDLVAIAAI